MARGDDKQLPKVYEALQEGAETSVEIAAITGLPPKHCSAWLNELRLMGMARIVRRDGIRFGHAGRRCHQWRAI